MSFLIIDILPFKPGRTIEEAVAYFDELKPVFEKHGFKRRDEPLAVAKLLRGETPADMVNLFETEDPEASLKGISGDPAYQAQISKRDQIFDLERASILLTKRV